MDQKQQHGKQGDILIARPGAMMALEQPYYPEQREACGKVDCEIRPVIRRRVQSGNEVIERHADVGDRPSGQAGIPERDRYIGPAELGPMQRGDFEQIRLVVEIEAGRHPRVVRKYRNRRDSQQRQ